MSNSYEERLERFRALFEKHNNERLARLYPDLPLEEVGVETGYKFSKVYVMITTGPQGHTQRMGRYMVEKRTGNIYGIKSWTQVNLRRMFGTLDTIDQYDWSEFHGRPLPGTDAERSHVQRETEIVSKHKKRGRKPKSANLSSKRKK